MKRMMPLTLGTAILLTACAVDLQAETLPPGQVDFGTFSPPKSGGEFAEINITSSLISLVAGLVENKDTDVAQLLKGLQQVRVSVIGMNDDNRGELQKRAENVRRQLDKGWEQIVRAQQDTKNVSIYLKTQNKDTIQGLVVVVLDGDQKAVFVNIVGNIKPSQLSLLGEKFNIDPLKKLGLGNERADDSKKVEN
jgi:hypothetical protein